MGNGVKGLLIRPQKLEDAGAVAALIKIGARHLAQTAGVHISPTRQTHGPQLRTAGIVAVAGNRIVGTVSFHGRGRRFHLFNLVVHPKMRRQGIAQKLVVELERIANASRAKVLSLHTIEETGALVPFTRLGFRIQSAKPEFLIGQPSERALTTVYMVKRLPGLPREKQEDGETHGADTFNRPGLRAGRC